MLIPKLGRAPGQTPSVPNKSQHRPMDKRQQLPREQRVLPRLISPMCVAAKLVNAPPTADSQKQQGLTAPESTARQSTSPHPNSYYQS
ncbi:hypothetical protein [Candidatus Steffania adelgidicola]|uniref:hypothetical protein n=1 Tax=Candidatus Steffania adelgidicola TaxID=1076626 RepID=UPI001D00B3B0|nr:hypothetical protein [Candidatus Steffania adelgidicola]UDG79961.1 hypothetical protein GFK82_00511 [Candidatus Steffania adelgidicola]